MKKSILLITTLVFALCAFNLHAGFEQAPPSFNLKDGRKAVWTDFQTANYNIKFHPAANKTEVVSTIVFETKQDGYPIFDLVTVPNAVYINGTKTTQNLVSTPHKASFVRLVNTKLKPGKHTLIVHSNLLSGTRYSKSRRKSSWASVSSGFFVRDLADRKFLEKYLPTNYEYDSYKMDMEVKIIGSKRWHSLFVNGQKTKIAENHYKVSFPAYYVSSSVFFHLVPINKFVRWYLKFPSIDGRKIPVTIYSKWRFMNSALKRKAWRVMKELERDYGAWPHDQLIIYGTGLKGGMEYAGATETSVVSLGHELQHSYFAKGMHPANGNSGWLDEAIASWRDKGHQTHAKPDYSSFNLGNHSVYTRKTDKSSYKKGRSFMAYIDYKLKENGKTGLKHFLRGYFNKRKFTNITTEIFRADLEAYAGMSFNEDFRRYILGHHNGKMKSHRNEKVINPHHPVITDKELESIL